MSKNKILIFLVISLFIIACSRYKEDNTFVPGSEDFECIWCGSGCIPYYSNMVDIMCVQESPPEGKECIKNPGDEIISPFCEIINKDTV